MHLLPNPRVQQSTDGRKDFRADKITCKIIKYKLTEYLTR